MSSTVGPPQSPAKQRALRIPLDYYKRWTALDRAKWLLAALATLIGGAYAGWLVAGHRSGAAARQFSPGHVTLAHAAWNDRCDACHEPGMPLNPHAGGSESLRQWLTGGTKPARLLNEQKCVACHPAATHHPRQIVDQVETCAACHHDHAGVDADLKQVASERCIACHADIAGHSTLAIATPAVNVASWATHPDFRSLDSGDPGRVKFNHRLHLLPGQYPRDAKPSALKRLSAIDKSYWNLLGYAQDASPDTVVQLDCSACHEFEETSGRLASTRLTTGSPEAAAKQEEGPSGASSSLVVGSVPASGAYALPIRYERHCASCHDTDLAATVEGPRRAVRASIPHGSSPGTIRGLLRGAYLAAESTASTAKQGGATFGPPADGPPADGPLVPRRAVPGRSLRSDDAGQSTGTSLDAIPVAARVRQAELQLATESHCGKCHPFLGAESMPGGVPVAAAMNSELLAVAPSQIPTIWLSKGGFDHAAHRALRCDACHESSSFEWSAGGKPPIDDAKPKIPRIDNCRQCHGDSPAETKASVAVRADCVTCHRYHAADEPPHGNGSPTHTPPPARRISTRDWLDGRFSRSELAEGIAP
jgi:hypothetical protein